MTRTVDAGLHCNVHTVAKGLLETSCSQHNGLLHCKDMHVYDAEAGCKTTCIVFTICTSQDKEQPEFIIATYSIRYSK